MSEPVKHSASPLPGFHDATAHLFQACSQLQLGHMVTVPGFTLMDSMSAIQIMDARMDSGMELPIDEIPQTDRIPASLGRQEYHPHQLLDGDDVVWIMDRLVACEASFHLGRALSQTIYTCLYFHDLKLLTPHEPAPPRPRPSTSKLTSPSPRELVFKALRAFIVATVKTCDMAWNELTKQNVYDGEDFSGDKSGLSLLEGTDPRDAIAQLDDALQWLSNDPILDERTRRSLKARLSLRKQILSATMLLAERDPASWMEVSLHCRFARKYLNALRPEIDGTKSTANANAADREEAEDGIEGARPVCAGLRDPSRQKAPSPRSMASFDPAYSRKLVASAPLRPVALPSAMETWDFLGGLIQGLQEAVWLLQRPSMLGWKMFFSCQAYGFQTKQTIPYVRSLYQSAVCDRTMIAGRLPLEWLTQAFFTEVAMVDPLLLHRLSGVGRSSVEGGHQTAWNAPPSLGQSVSYFSQRIAGHLVNYLTTLSQNRSRQKRSLSKAYVQWTALAEEASELGERIEAVLRPEDYMSDSLFASVQHAALDVTLQVILCGFELELYRRDEWAGMYFVASRICSEQALVCEDLQLGLSKRLPTLRKVRGSMTMHYLGSQQEMARALEAMAIGTVMLLQVLDAKSTGRRWPLVGVHSDPPSIQAETTTQVDTTTTSLARATFMLRLKWLEIPNDRSSFQSIQTLWDEYTSFKHQVASLSESDLVQEAETNYQRAMLELQRYSSRPSDETRSEMCIDQHREMIQALTDTCRANLAFLTDLKSQLATAQEQEQGQGQERSAKAAFERHRWFPAFH